MQGRSSESDTDELKALLQKSPEHYYLLEMLEAIETKKQDDSSLVQDGWSKLQEKLSILKNTEEETIEAVPPVKKLQPRWWMNKAAVITAAVLLGGIVWFTLVKNNKATNSSLAAAKEQQVTVPYGMSQKKLLPDGSEVWVNAGSSIRYTEDPLQNTREVFLEGEAFFKVKKDPEHPFIVHAGNITVRALGTEFNVQAYNNENIVATLLSGKVQITMAEKPDQKIILVPNEKLTVTKKDVNAVDDDKEDLKELSFQVEEIKPQPSINTVEEVAWLQNRLAFKNEAFYKLAKRMERKYDMHIIFQDEALKNEDLTGTFENESIDKALKLLQMTTPFRYRIEKDSVFLNPY